MPLALIATVYSLSTWFEFLIGPAVQLKALNKVVEGRWGRVLLLQLGSGGFLANHADKVHFLEKIDKKQLVTG